MRKIFCIGLVTVGLIIWGWAIISNVKGYMEKQKSGIYVAIRDTIAEIIANVGYSIIATIVCTFATFTSDGIEEIEKKARISVEVARVRDADNLKNESIIGKLKYNTEIMIVKEVDEFYIVTYEYCPPLKKEVYIHKDNIE